MLDGERTYRVKRVVVVGCSVRGARRGVGCGMSCMSYFLVGGGWGGLCVLFFVVVGGGGAGFSLLLFGFFLPFPVYTYL